MGCQASSYVHEENGFLGVLSATGNVIVISDANRVLVWKPQCFAKLLFSIFVVIVN